MLGTAVWILGVAGCGIQGGRSALREGGTRAGPCTALLLAAPTHMYYICCTHRITHTHTHTHITHTPAPAPHTCK